MPKVIRGAFASYDPTTPAPAPVDPRSLIVPSLISDLQILAVHNPDAFEAIALNAQILATPYRVLLKAAPSA